MVHSTGCRIGDGEIHRFNVPGDKIQGSYSPLGTISPDQPWPSAFAARPVGGSSAGDGCGTGAAGVLGLLASSRAELPPTMFGEIQDLGPGPRPVGGGSAGDGFGTSAAGVLGLLASSRAELPPTMFGEIQDLVLGTRPVGGGLPAMAVGQVQQVYVLV